MVHLLCLSQQLEEAQSFIEKILVKTNVGMWVSLLPNSFLESHCTYKPTITHEHMISCKKWNVPTIQLFFI